MRKLPRVQKGDKVAIVSPSFAAPGAWPHVYELGCQRLREQWGLVPVSFPTTALIGASKEARAADLVAAFTDPEIKAVIASIGGNDQVTYVHQLDPQVFKAHPKPFFGYSDNSHFANFLWLQGIPSYYGGSLFTQFAMQGAMDDFTVEYLTHALFQRGEKELQAATEYNDINLDWGDKSLLTRRREYEPNEGWYWDGTQSARGLLWGGCLESVDEMLRHNVPIPTLEQFAEVVLMLETSEEMPDAEYVFRVLRALGERGVLAVVQGVMVGRPKSWEFQIPRTKEEKVAHRAEQRKIIFETIRQYNSVIPIVQNLDFGHTDPQIPMPYGGMVHVDVASQNITATF